jgi:hypothetical protein
VNRFDAQYNLFHNPDVARSRHNPLRHYQAVGWTVGRDASARFDTLG